MNKQNFLLFVVLFLFITCWQTTSIFADISLINEQLQQKLDKKINVFAEDSDFSKVINSICDQLGIKVEIDSSTLKKFENVGIDLELEKGRGELALKLLSVQYGISYIGVNEDSIFVADRFHPRLRSTTKPAIKKFVPYKHEAQVISRMKDQFLKLNFNSTSLSEIIDSIRNLTGLNIIIHPRVYKEKTEEQLTIDLNVENGSVLSVFEVITKTTGIEFFTTNGLVVLGKRPQEFVTKTYQIKGLLEKLSKDKIIHSIKKCCEEKHWGKGLFVKITNNVLIVRNRRNVIPRITWALGILRYDAL